MQYPSLYKLLISDSLDCDWLLQKVREAPSDWIMLADTSYQCIQKPEFDFGGGFDRVFVPQILPYSQRIDNPFGRKINHVSIQPNLHTQPVMVGPDKRPDFIPFCLVAHQQMLDWLLERCTEYHKGGPVEDLFLELSLLLDRDYFNPMVVENWLATVQLRDCAIMNRSLLMMKYLPECKEYFEITENMGIGGRHKRVTYKSSHPNRKGFLQLWSLVHNHNVVLTDRADSRYRFTHRSFAVDPEIPDVDNYLALGGYEPDLYDTHSTFAQITLPSSKHPGPVYTPDLDVIGTFAVKQFSDKVNFSPPFTHSSDPMITALEILASMRPREIVVESDVLLPYLVAAEDGAESIKRQTFITKIVDFCAANNIVFQVVGDLCRLSSPSS